MPIKRTTVYVHWLDREIVFCTAFRASNRAQISSVALGWADVRVIGWLGSALPSSPDLFGEEGGVGSLAYSPAQAKQAVV